MEVKAEQTKHSLTKPGMKSGIKSAPKSASPDSRFNSPARRASRWQFEETAFVVVPQGREALAAEVERSARRAGVAAVTKEDRAREGLAEGRGQGRAQGLAEGRGAGTEEDAVRQTTTVEFFANEDVRVAASTAKMTVTARVIGDELMSFHSSSKEAGGQLRESDAVVEMIPNERGRAAKVTVRHPDLGLFELRVEADSDFVRVEVFAPDGAAAAMVSEQMETLRSALEDAGVVLQGFRVRAAEDNRAQEGHKKKLRYHSIQEEA